MGGIRSIVVPNRLVLHGKDRESSVIKSFAKKVRGRMLWAFSPAFQYRDANPIGQIALDLQYRELLAQGRSPVALNDAGFRIYSQAEEDGILHYIFSLIGTKGKRCVEICAGTGMECNTANLILNRQWIGLLFEGNEENARIAREFFAKHPDSALYPPPVVCEWITRDNINSLIEKNDFKGEIDLLSLDIDGVDYWLWQAITVVSPRVVVLEYNHLWGPDVSVTVPYADDFKAWFSPYGSDYAGASLRAFVKLGTQKGYRLVGTNAIGTNAFFVRSDIECPWLPEIDPAVCFDHPRAKFGMTHRLPTVKDREWVEV